MSAKRIKTRSEAPDAPLSGRADLARLREMDEEEITRTSPDELADLPHDFWDDAEVVTPQPKEAISLRVDQDVLEWFRKGGPRYQSRMNAVLRSYMTTVEGRRRRRSSRPKGKPTEGST